MTPPSGQKAFWDHIFFLAKPVLGPKFFGYENKLGLPSGGNPNLPQDRSVSALFVCCRSPTQPNSNQVGVTMFLVCYPPYPNSVLTKFFFDPTFFSTQFFFTQKKFRPKFCWPKKNSNPFFFTKIDFRQKKFYQKNFRAPFFFLQIFFSDQLFFI